MSDDFFSFDEALDELRLKEEELKRLVSEGEIRAFRKGDTMKLRRSDVESLRAELSGEVVDLGEGTEELVFEDDPDIIDEAGMATQEIAGVETLIDDDIEDVGELELDDEPAPRRATSRGARAAAPAPAAGVHRTGAIAANADVEETEGSGMLIALAVTTALLTAAMPVALSVAAGGASGLARTIAALFPGATFN
ncbi:MAG: hypothetical protein ACI8QZ_002796 [Chlamydiales bacterium]